MTLPQKCDDQVRYLQFNKSTCYAININELTVAARGSKPLVTGHTLPSGVAVSEQDLKIAVLEKRVSELEALTAWGSAKLEGSGSIEVRSAGPTKVSGSIVALSNGSKCVARLTDGVVSATGGAMIIGGNPTVLA